MSTMQSACLVLHGKAATREDVLAAVAAIRDEGVRVDVRETREPGDARRFAREAMEAGSGIIIAGGGDGTVGEIVDGLVSGSDLPQSLPSLGIMPLGTANDLARACGIPLEPLEALRLAVSGPDVRVDVGRVNGRCFLNMATGGFGTQVTVETADEMKQSLGRIAYLLTALTRFTSIRPARGRVSAPGMDWQGEFFLLAVGNGRQAGGGHSLFPDALLNDGLLDVKLIPHPPGDEFAQILGVLLREGLGVGGPTPVSARVPRVQIETEEPMQVNLDGEPITDTKFHFEVVAQRLRMRLPEGCPLLG